MEKSENFHRNLEKRTSIFQTCDEPSDRQEYIVCAAILCRDEEALEFSLQKGPCNVPPGKGIVFTGYRHNSIVELMTSHGYSASNETCVYGFLTSKDKFVTRGQAMHIAKESCQVKMDCDDHSLTSDHLY